MNRYLCKLLVIWHVKRTAFPSVDTGTEIGPGAPHLTHRRTCGHCPSPGCAALAQFNAAHSILHGVVEMQAYFFLKYLF